jgi:hypothetical protein
VTLPGQGRELPAHNSLPGNVSGSGKRRKAPRKCIMEKLAAELGHWNENKGLISKPEESSLILEAALLLVVPKGFVTSSSRDHSPR